MNKFFQKLSLQVKLLLLTLLPIALIVFLSFRLYKEKTSRQELLKGYVDRINISSDISDLLDALQLERRYSYAFAMEKNIDSRAAMEAARPVTDLAIKTLEQRNDSTLKDFTDYTFLDKLSAFRAAVDTNASPDLIMQYYTTSIFRLNTLNIIVPVGSNVYLKPVFADLVAQKILSEMITYLGIIRSNIYNALYTQKNMAGILYGTIGVYQVYNSYETEFLIKASSPAIEQYKQIRNGTSLKPTIAYTDSLFKKFSFDSLYNAELWWKMSGEATDKLRAFRKDLMFNVKSKMDSIYKGEEESLNLTLIFLIIAIGIVFAFMLYTTRIITQMLSGLNKAAQKIALGITGLPIKSISNDAIGNLTESISKIDNSNRQLASAADAIGKGNFNISVFSRGDEDLLSHAIMRMRDNLRRFTYEVEKSKEQFKQVADTAPVMIWMTNESKECNFVNKCWLKFTGRKAEQEMGYGWIEGMHPDDFPLCNALFNEAFHERKDYSAEYRFKRFDGEYRWLSETGVPRYSPEGKFEGYIGTCTDIHDLKVLDQRKEDFIKMASHELKTPVTSIKGYVQFLMSAYHEQDNDKQLSAQMVQTSLTTIHKQIDKLSRLMSELLDLSRIDTGKLELKKQHFNLNELVKEMVEDVQTTTTQRISIINDVHGNVIADHDRIAQVVLNLLTNAIKYSRNGKTVEIKIYTAALHTIAVTVMDHGIGIDKKDQEKIFERFYRVEGKSEQTYPGFGIGLFIAREIITGHGGMISVESKKGEGSAFTFTLPIA